MPDAESRRPDGNPPPSDGNSRSSNGGRHRSDHRADITARPPDDNSRHPDPNRRPPQDNAGRSEPDRHPPDIDVRSVEADPRPLLVEGVRAAALMQVATLGDGGFPAICHVWYQPEFEPDRLYFLSREDREHTINLRRDPRVAASIALEVPPGLGGRVRGVTLNGLAREIPDADLPAAAAAFIARWPRAAAALSPLSPRPEISPAAPPVPRPGGPPRTPRSRLYEIAVSRWVLFDEVNFPAQPRLTILAH